MPIWSQKARFWAPFWNPLGPKMAPWADQVPLKIRYWAPKWLDFSCPWGPLLRPVFRYLPEGVPGAIWASFWSHLACFWSPFGALREPFGSTLGPIALLLEPFGLHSERFGSDREPFGTTLGPIYCDLVRIDLAI